MKRILSLILTFAIISTVIFVPTVASAYTDGTYGDLTYLAYDDHIEITSCNKSVVSVDIPSEINGLPVTSINDYVFSECASLTDITIPDGVTSILWEAFRGCTSLPSITIPASVTYIGSAAFSNCGSLNIEVSEQNDVYSSSNGVLFNKDKSEIISYAKDKIQHDYIIPDGVTRICGDAFEGCADLISVTIPDNVTSIGDFAFQGCTSLPNISIPASVIGIGRFAFEDCTSLPKITIPDSVTSIGFGVFSGCGSLYIEVSEQNRWYSSSNGVLFNKDKSYIVSYAKDKIQSVYTIPNGVKSISDFAFAYCTGLTSVTIPDSVISIYADAFVGCTSLTNVNIGNSVRDIDVNAFAYCTGLPNISIPDSVTNIASQAFLGCTCLTSITIPDSVTSIRSSAFDDCANLTDVYYGGSQADWNAIEIDTGNDNLLTATIHYNSTGPEVTPTPTASPTPTDGKPGTYGDLSYIAYSDHIEITNCNNSPVSVEIPANIDGLPVTGIGELVFNGCESLTSVTIPDSVTSIGHDAFAYCISLPNITIPDSVTSIGEVAFRGCASLTSVAISNSVTSIGDYTFLDCTSLLNIIIPDSVTSIGQSAFDSCKSLTSVTIPDTVRSIGIMAFEGCKSLTDVYYSGSQADWETIEIDVANDSLYAATIHYNSTGPEVTPTPTPTVSPIPDSNRPLDVKPIEPVITDNKIEIPVTVQDPVRADELNDVELYIAEYDDNGVLVNLTFGKKSDILGDTITLTADIPNDKYKIMLWDGCNVPLMDVISPDKS